MRYKANYRSLYRAHSTGPIHFRWGRMHVYNLFMHIYIHIHTYTHTHKYIQYTHTHVITSKHRHVHIQHYEIRATDLFNSQGGHSVNLKGWKTLQIYAMIHWKSNQGNFTFFLLPRFKWLFKMHVKSLVKLFLLRASDARKCCCLLCFQHFSSSVP